MPATALKIAASNAPEFEPLQILIAEDNDVTSELTKLVLTNRGHSITCVGDGKSARKALLERAFDVCLIDFRLPGMNGLEVVQSYQDNAKPGTAPPIFIGMTSDVEGLLAHPIGCERLDVVFGKPFKAEELHRAIEKVRSAAQVSNPSQSRFGSTAWFDAKKSEKSGADNGVYWSAEAGKPLPERRRAPRKTVSLDGTKLIRKNGEKHPCRIVSLSSLGAAVEADCLPEIGEHIQVGQTKAIVVRTDSDGIGVEFIPSN